MNTKQEGAGRCCHVGLLGSILGLASLLLPWLSVRESRLAAGESLAFHHAVAAPLVVSILAVWLAALWLSLCGARRRRYVALGTAGALLLPLTLLSAGMGATSALNPDLPLSRASLGAGVWLSLVAAYLLLHAGRTNLRAGSRVRRVLAAAGPLLVTVLVLSGALDQLSLARELAGNEHRFIEETGRHVALSFGSVALGACIAVPLGIAAARRRRAERPIFLISSTIETIPSLALFGLIIAPLSALSFAFPTLREIGIRGVGATPAVIALVLYSLLPIVHNTYVGLRQVSPAALDAGRGMGMSPRQLSWRVEYPLAVPLIGEGIRTATIQSIGNTTVAALIGAGGLGHFIFQGLGQAAPDLILLGALPVIGLALAADLLMQTVIRGLTPRGIRTEAPS